MSSISIPMEEMPERTAGPAAQKLESSSSAGEPKGPLAWLAEMRQMAHLALERTGRVESLLEHHHRLDRAKEEHIARLHTDLQRSRRGELERLKDPLLLEWIGFRGEMEALASNLRSQSREELTREAVLRHFEEMLGDIEVILYRHGVAPFSEPGEIFNPERQTAVRTVPTRDVKVTGRIAERLRVGFSLGDRLLSKERVAVFANGITLQAAVERP